MSVAALQTPWLDQYRPAWLLGNPAASLSDWSVPLRGLEPEAGFSRSTDVGDGAEAHEQAVAALRQLLPRADWAI